MSTLETLLSMGFPENSIKRAIELTGNKGVQEAMDWLLAHADDEPMSTESSSEAAAAADDPVLQIKTDKTNEEKTAEEEEKNAKSIKCDECDKLFKNSEEVEFHAVKSGHSKFSESTEEKAPLTEEQRKQKLLELDAKMKERRRQKQLEEEQENREKEKKRIEMGKNMAEIKRKRDEDEMKKICAERRREKLEDKQARERVKAQIEADREARRQKQAGAAPEPVKAAPAPVQTPAGPKKEYDECRIQFRFPSSPPVVQTFKAKEPLSAVNLFVTMHHPPSDPTQTITLSTTFPRKTFTVEEMQTPLNVLGLVPSSVLMVQYK